VEEVRTVGPNGGQRIREKRRQKERKEEKITGKEKNFKWG
jgi:hypothetical protein